MSRTHMEIQIHSLTSFRKTLATTGRARHSATKIQRLEAITRLHFAQEQEIYRSLEDGS